MKKLILLFAAILISCQLMSQMSRLGAKEFSTWVKTEYVANVSYKSDNVYDSYEPEIDYHLQIEYEYPESNGIDMDQSDIAWKVLIVAVTSNIMEGIGDGLYDEGKATGNRDQIKLGKLLQAGSLGMKFLYIPIARKSSTHWLWFTVVEVGVRMTTFDPSYNTTRGLRMNQIGSTSYWDQALSWSKQPESMLGWTRVVFGIATVKFTFDTF